MAAKKEEAKKTEAAKAEGTGTDLAQVNTQANELMNGLDLSELGFDEETLKDLTGIESIDASEIRIPYATLISKANRDNEVGDIVFPDGTVIKGAKGEVAEDISILKVQPVRVMFPEPFNPKNSFICRSLDGKVGAPDGKYAGRPCVDCEFSQYPPEGGSSPCRDQRLLLCSRNDGSLFHIQVGGVGVGVWKKFMSAQAFHLLPKVNSLLGAIKTNIAVTMVDTDFGAFPALDFQVDQKNFFVGKERLKENLQALKSYKEFEREHLETAATQSRVQMAAGEDVIEADGENSDMF